LRDEVTDSLERVDEFHGDLSIEREYGVAHRHSQTTIFPPPRTLHECFELIDSSGTVEIFGA
jgi:hypothetical protein